MRIGFFLSSLLHLLDLLLEASDLLPQVLVLRTQDLLLRSIVLRVALVINQSVAVKLLLEGVGCKHGVLLRSAYQNGRGMRPIWVSSWEFFVLSLHLLQGLCRFQVPVENDPKLALNDLTQLLI